MDGLKMKYFVLKPAGRGPYAQASRAAMRQYADAILHENEALALGLMAWVDRECDEVGEEIADEA